LLQFGARRHAGTDAFAPKPPATDAPFRKTELISSSPYPYDQINPVAAGEIGPRENGLEAP